MRSFLLLVSLALALPLRGRGAEPGRTPPLRELTIVLSPEAQELERRYAELAAKHFTLRHAALKTSVVQSAEPVANGGVGSLVVYAGRPAAYPLLQRRLAQLGQAAVGENNPGPEGFFASVGAAPGGSGNVALVAGVEPRSVLYGLGWLLKESRLDDRGIHLPLSEIRTAPRAKIRVTCDPERQAMDPSSARATKVRDYKLEEGAIYREHHWLLGANQLFHGWGSSVPVSPARYDAATDKGVNTSRPELAERYGLDHVIVHSINGIGRENMKPGWNALSAGGPHNANVCVSVPEARAFLLDIKETFFRHAGRIDRVVFSPADVAGCECERCAPWPRTYYTLLQEMAERLHRHHPRAKVVFANQDFQIADNEWFFEKIRVENPSWLNGYCMAPGGSEEKSYGDVVVNPVWSRYAGTHPGHNFLRSRLRYLPPAMELLSLPDISHWKRAEHGIAYVDPLFSEVYHRRTFNARPRAYHRILRGDLAYVDGLIGYSEGNYDDFNKFLLLRLAWDPDLGVEQVTREYYAYYCGEAAADLLAEAALQGELNYERPVLQNGDGIRRAYELTVQAGPRIPRVIREKDWRFAMLAQRAATDLYIFQRQDRLHRVHASELAALEKLLAAGEATSAVRLQQSMAALGRALEESADERRLREEALAWDDITDRHAAIRSSALLAIKEHDGAGVRWLVSRLREASAFADADARSAALRAAVFHDRVGPGEFYEDCGTLAGQPHFDFGSGELYYGTGAWPADSRPSQRSYNYSHSHQPGLRFTFDGLYPGSDYEISFTHPNPSGVSFAINSPNEFDVVANGERLGRFVPSGKGFERGTFKLPARLIADGRLELRLERVPGRARSTCISELWVRKAGARP